MKLREFQIFLHPLEFKFPFVITQGKRTHTDAIFLKLSIEHEGELFDAYGEATIPPYLAESTTSVKDFILNYQWKSLTSEENFLHALKGLKNYKNQPCSTTILEMAFLDALAKIHKKNLRQYLGLTPFVSSCYSSYTISFSQSMEETLKKIEEFKFFKNFKIKITSEHDLSKIPTLLKQIGANRFMVDANQCFSDYKSALTVIHELKNMGCVALEQPISKDNWEDASLLKNTSPLPIIADEAFQNDTDFNLIEKSFHGINIKILKLGGVLPALSAIKLAKSKNLLVQVGCMSESSLACAMASVLVDEARFVDLDGPLLVKNDPFTGLIFDKEGKIFIENKLGIGVVPRNDAFMVSVLEEKIR
jgi:L-alanine-DL-glutamate epimerase-like enolase superfamily enzyme